MVTYTIWKCENSRFYTLFYDAIVLVTKETYFVTWVVKPFRGRPHLLCILKIRRNTVMPVLFFKSVQRAKCIKAYNSKNVPTLRDVDRLSISPIYTSTKVVVYMNTLTNVLYRLCGTRAAHVQLYLQRKCVTPSHLIFLVQYNFSSSKNRWRTCYWSDN